MHQIQQFRAELRALLAAQVVHIWVIQAVGNLLCICSTACAHGLTVSIYLGTIDPLLCMHIRCGDSGSVKLKSPCRC